MEKITPEGFEIAQAYLMARSDVSLAATQLSISEDEVQRQLQKREVRDYIDRVFNESGFRNREKMGALWDEILAAKLEEMDDTGMGSSKDIVEIMEKMHKFNMDQIAAQTKLMELEIKREALKVKEEPKIQVNQQTNNHFGGQNYNALMDRILEDVSQ